MRIIQGSRCVCRLWPSCEAAARVAVSPGIAPDAVKHWRADVQGGQSRVTNCCKTRDFSIPEIELTATATGLKNPNELRVLKLISQFTCPLYWATSRRLGLLQAVTMRSSASLVGGVVATYRQSISWTVGAGAPLTTLLSRTPAIGLCGASPLSAAISPPCPRR